MSIEVSRKRWEENTTGERWKNAVIEKSANYCKGIAKFLGTETCPAGLEERWKQGIEKVSVDDFDKAVKEKADIWEQNLRRALTLTNPNDKVFKEKIEET